MICRCSSGERGKQDHTIQSAQSYKINFGKKNPSKMRLNLIQYCTGKIGQYVPKSDVSALQIRNL